MREVDYIITRLFEERKFKQLISPYQFSDNAEADLELRKDFEQEIIMQLLLYKDKKLLRNLYRDDRIDYFLLGIIRRQFHQTGGNTFNTKYLQWERNRETFCENER